MENSLRRSPNNKSFIDTLMITLRTRMDRREKRSESTETRWPHMRRIKWGVELNDNFIRRNFIGSLRWPFNQHPHNEPDWHLCIRNEIFPPVIREISNHRSHKFAAATRYTIGSFISEDLIMVPLFRFSCLAVRCWRSSIQISEHQHSPTAH